MEAADKDWISQSRPNAKNLQSMQQLILGWLLNISCIKVYIHS